MQVLRVDTQGLVFLSNKRSDGRQFRAEFAGLERGLVSLQFSGSFIPDPKHQALTRQGTNAGGSGQDFSVHLSYQRRASQKPLSGVFFQVTFQKRSQCLVPAAEEGDHAGVQHLSRVMRVGPSGKATGLAGVAGRRLASAPRNKEK